MTLGNLSTTATNMQWFMSSDFQANPTAPVTTLYVSMATGDTGPATFEYGTIVVSNGIRN